MQGTFSHRHIRSIGALLIFGSLLLFPWRHSAFDLVGASVWTTTHPDSLPLFGVREPGWFAAYLIGTIFNTLGWAGVALLGAGLAAGVWFAAVPALSLRLISGLALLSFAAAFALGSLLWFNPAYSLALLCLVGALLLALRLPRFAPFWLAGGAVLSMNASAISVFLFPTVLLFWSQFPHPRRQLWLGWAAALLGACATPSGFPWPEPGTLPAVQLGWREVLAIGCCVPAFFSGLLAKKLRKCHLLAAGLLAVGGLVFHSGLWFPFALVSAHAARGPAFGKINRGKWLVGAMSVLLVFLPLLSSFESWNRRGVAWSGVLPSYWEKPLSDVLGEGPLYANPGAKAALAIEGVMPPQLAGDTEMMRDYRAAQQSPELWRTIDRKIRFGAVFLYGDISAFRPLLSHLTSAADWRCVHFDHQAFVFLRRPSQPVNLVALDLAKLDLKNYPARVRSEFLTAIAARLAECNQPKAAKPYLEEALKLTPESPATLTAAAMERLADKDLKEANRLLDKALLNQPDFVAAMALKIRVLLAARRVSEAYRLSDTLVQLRPRDPASLFLRAQVAHEMHAYDAEIETLEKIVRLAQAEGYPTVGYRIYLAQAYAARGRAAPALREFDAALQEPGNLSDEQVKFILETSRQIRERSGIQ